MLISLTSTTLLLIAPTLFVQGAPVHGMGKGALPLDHPDHSRITIKTVRPIPPSPTSSIDKNTGEGKVPRNIFHLIEPPDADWQPVRLGHARSRKAPSSNFGQREYIGGVAHGRSQEESATLQQKVTTDNGSDHKQLQAATSLRGQMMDYTIAGTSPEQRVGTSRNGDQEGEKTSSHSMSASIEQKRDDIPARVTLTEPRAGHSRKGTAMHTALEEATHTPSHSSFEPAVNKLEGEASRSQKDLLPFMQPPPAWTSQEHKQWHRVWSNYLRQVWRVRDDPKLNWSHLPQLPHDPQYTRLAKVFRYGNKYHRTVELEYEMRMEARLRASLNRTLKYMLAKHLNRAPKTITKEECRRFGVPYSDESGVEMPEQDQDRQSIAINRH